MLKRTALFAALAVAPLISVADSMPDVRVGPMTFQDEPVHAALMRVVKGTGVSVVMADEIPGTLTASGVAGKLDVVVGKICAYSDAKCEFKGGAKGGAIVVSSRSQSAAAPAAPVYPAARVAPPEQVASAPVAKPLPEAFPPEYPRAVEVHPLPEAVPAVVAMTGPAAVADPVRAAVVVEAEEVHPEVYEVTIRNGEGLRTWLSREATKMGVRLSWSLREDRIASRDMTFIGSSRDEVMNDILVAFRLPGYLVKSTNTLYIVKDHK